MLSQIVKMLAENQLTSTSEISDLLGVSPELTLVMLSDLEQMGILKKVSGFSPCKGSCPGCSADCGSSAPDRVVVWELSNKENIQ